MSTLRSAATRGLIALPLLAGVALAQPALRASAAQRPQHHGAAVRWLVVNTKTHTATLTLIAGYTGAVGGFNFNGYGNGKMVITIPVKYRVNVVFSNNGGSPHSAVFAPYSQRKSPASFTAAFSGASSPNPMMGIMKGAKPQKFSFVASKVGTYALVCAVPGHALSGMWDVLKVTSGGSASISPSK